MAYQAVIFDLDDTLLKTYPAKWKQHKETAKHFYGIDLSDDLLRTHWGKPTHELVKHFYNHSMDTEVMVNQFRSLDAAHPKDAHPEAFVLLDVLQKRNFHISIVTNSYRNTAIADLERLNFSPTYFNAIYGIEENGVYKPDPEALRPILKKLEGEGIVDGIVYVGDALIDFYAARGAGIDFIGITTGVTSEKDFKDAGAKYIISKLTELPSLLRRRVGEIQSIRKSKNMLLFLDTADITEIEKFSFLIHGVTTTPTIIKRSGLNTENFMRKVRSTFPHLEIHVEALEEDAIATEKLIKEFAKKSWYDSDKVVFKVPISQEGLRATKQIKQKDPSIRINLHMAFSPAQASLAMLAKPDYIAPLIGRYADRVAGLMSHGNRSLGADAGYDMLENIMQCKNAMKSDAIILASSIRTVHDFTVASLLGSDAATLPTKVLEDSLEHPMTQEGVEVFWQDLA